jgi:serum/glucocorticoid-regulated kinase 2
VKNATKSQLLIGQALATNGDKVVVKLEDFKIKRVIDKGSFGKVFLVVNTNDNKVYAMKRINKDILIEKG